MSDRPQNKNLRPNPEKLGVVPLPVGWGTRLVRIAATKVALEWFAGLSSRERGQVVRAAYEAARQTEDAPPIDTA